MDLITIWDSLSFSVLPTFGYAFAGCLWDARTYAPIVLTGTTLCVVVHLIKHSIPGTASWSRRPVGACHCDALNRDGVVEGAPGFPSGHTALAVFFALALTARVGWLRPYALIWAALVGYSRVAKHCHTWLQVISGGAIGYMAAMWLA